MRKRMLLGILMGMITVTMFSFKLSVSAEEVFANNNSHEAIEILDNLGRKVEVSQVMIQPRGATPPTSLRWVEFGKPYHSNPFSASGTRYSESIFGLKNSKSAKLDFKLGGFKMFLTDRPDPGAILYSANMPLEYAPYTVNTSAYFYFAVDNPKKGQTYSIIPK